MQSKLRLEGSLTAKMESKWRLESSLERQMESKWLLERRSSGQVAPKRGQVALGRAVGGGGWGQLGRVHSLYPFQFAGARGTLEERYVGFLMGNSQLLG